MSSFKSISAQLQKLIDRVNAKTGGSATDITSAIDILLGGSVIEKLDTPVIRLVVEEPGEPGEPEYDTSAILGRAVLGRMILGSTGGDGLPRLAAPEIWVETANTQKLDSPVIFLESEDD